jgi:iron complex transport system substrate-binding protein
MVKGYGIAALAVGLALVVAGCGSSHEAVGPLGGSTVTTAAPVSSTFPVMITDCGRTETFTKPPSRIVIMNGGADSGVTTILALGLGAKVVANAEDYGMADVPGLEAQIKALPTGGVHLDQAGDIGREAMLSLKPDFVYSVYDGGFDAKNGYATRDDLAKIGANTYIPNSNCDLSAGSAPAQSVQSTYDMLQDFGKIFGVSARAQQLISESQSRIAAVEAKLNGPGRPGLGARPNVMIISPGMAAMGGSEFSAIGANGLFNDLITKAGGHNPFADSSGQIFANTSEEKVAAVNVQALVIYDYDDPDPAASAEHLFKLFPQWDASKSKRFIVLSDSLDLGPDNYVAVEKIAQMLYPSLFPS